MVEFIRTKVKRTTTPFELVHSDVNGCYPTRKPKPAQRHIRRTRLWATPLSVSGTTTNGDSMSTSSSKC